MSAIFIGLTDIMTVLTRFTLSFLLENTVFILVVLNCKKQFSIMGFFDKFKSPREIAKEEIVETPWHVLGRMEQLDALVEESKNKPVAIFKHSTRCGISRGVLKMFERNYSLNDEQFKLYFLDLLQNREISNEIATRFGVQHESPQLLVIKDGKVVHHHSHHAIDAAHLSQFV